MFVPFAKPFLGEEEAVAAREAILSGWVTQGPRVKAFEAAFKDYIGVSHACAVSSCTTALHMALLTVGVRPGDVVVTVSHSFIATANSVRACGAENVFVDIDPETYNIDPVALERCLREDCEERNGALYYRHLDRVASGESPLRFHRELAGKKPTSLGRVAAVLPVHQIGIPCDIGQIVTIAKRYGLPVVEDAACAIGSEISPDGGKTWEKIGKPHGDIVCFSFHPRKLLTTGDGGMLTTNNPDYDAKFRLLRHHGMSVPDAVRHSSNKVIFEEYVMTAFNYRMTDIQAAVGIEQLKRLDDSLQKRRRLATLYGNLLSDIPWLKTLKVSQTIRPNWQSYPVRLLQGAPMGQVELMQYLLDNGVATRRGVMNAHQEPAYSGRAYSLPQSECARDHTILLPFFSEMTEEETGYVSSVIHNAATGKVSSQKLRRKGSLLSR